MSGFLGLACGQDMACKYLKEDLVSRFRQPAEGLCVLWPAKSLDSELEEYYTRQPNTAMCLLSPRIW